MTGGTKVFLAVFGLLLLLLIVYYGFMGGTGPDQANGGPGVQDPLASPTENGQRANDGLNQDRLAQHESTGLFAGSGERDGVSGSGTKPTWTTPFGLAPAVGDQAAGPTDSLLRYDADRRPMQGAHDPILPTPQPIGTSGQANERTALSDTSDALRRPQTTNPMTRSVSDPVGGSVRTNTAESVRYVQYTVQKYDTLSDIALDWFNDASKWDLIVEANPGINPNFIREGSTLRLPPKSARRSGPRVAGTGDSSSVGPQTHVIRPGETLSSIAQRYYGTQNRWRDIYNANRQVIGGDPDTLHAGDRLVIP